MQLAFLFDVFGTLVDWRGSVTRQLGDAFATAGIKTDPGAVAVAWRDEYDPAMAPVRAGQRPYARLDILHRENLDRVLANFGLAERIGDAARDRLVGAWQRLDPWPDSVAGLRLIRLKGLVAPCSNGSIAMMAHLARHAGFDWDCVLGADIARSYKPDPEVYLKSCAALGLEPRQVMMVAAHNADLAAARAAGLRTGFVPRPDEHADPARQEPAATGPWDVLGTDLVDLAAKL